MMPACSFAALPPPTLRVQLSTPTVAPPAIVPVATFPPGALAGSRPVDPQVAGLLDQVQSDRLMYAIGSLADMFTRHVLSQPTGSIKGIGGARDWLLAEFTSIRDANPEQSINVWTQTVPFSWNGIRTATQNVIAVFQGTDVGAGVVVVGAHYDSISADFQNGQAYAPGANDNGSGVAAMLEIAQILAPRPHRATILFVAFTAEETGRQGSLAFVKSYLQSQNPPIALRGMINLDIVGSALGRNGEVDERTIRLFSAEPNDSPSRQLARQLALYMATYLDDVDPVLQSAEERAGRWGDQQSFSAAGYPSVRFIQGLEDMSRQHSPLDTMDGIQPAYLMRTTRAALVSVLLLADGPTPPVGLAFHSLPGDPRTQRLTWTAAPDAARYLVTLRQTSSLSYDQILTVDASSSPELTWTGFAQYATVAVGTIDASGRMGPLSAELPIPLPGTQ